MLEDFLVSIGSLVPTGSAMEQLPSDALLLPYLCSILGAMVLSKFTSNLGNLTLVLNYTALFIGASISTWLMRGIDLPMDHTIHQPLLVSMIGMLAGAFAMMWWLRSNNAHV